MDLNIALEEDNGCGGFDLNIPLQEDIISNGVLYLNQAVEEDEFGNAHGDADTDAGDDGDAHTDADDDDSDVDDEDADNDDDTDVDAGGYDDSDGDEHLNEPEHDNGFDLNLTLDEFGAVDLDFLQNAEHGAQNHTPVEVHHRRKDMTDLVRRQVYQALLARSKNGKLCKKDTGIVAD